MLRSPSQVIALRRAPDSDILSLKQQAMLFGAVSSSIQSPGRRRSCVIRVPGGLICSISEEARSASSWYPDPLTDSALQVSPVAAAEDAASQSQPAAFCAGPEPSCVTMGALRCHCLTVLATASSGESPVRCRGIQDQGRGPEPGPGLGGYLAPSGMASAVPPLRRHRWSLHRNRADAEAILAAGDRIAHPTLPMITAG